MGRFFGGNDDPRVQPPVVRPVQLRSRRQFTLAPFGVGQVLVGQPGWESLEKRPPHNPHPIRLVHPS
jgi:hypothetical protein